jgi:molybdopterin molybdotransferase
VRRRLRVALFSTGDELHQPGTPLPPGGIYAANGFALAALLTGMGCVVDDLGRLPDDLAATRAALVAAAARHDLIVSSGGVSVGEEDHVKAAVAAEGRIDLWRVAMRPGRPLALGRIGQTSTACWFIGLPGNPVSAFVTFVVLARHLVARLQGRRAAPPRPYPLEAGFAWEKTLPLHEFLRVRRGADGRLECFANQDSSLIRSLTWAEGLAIKPPGVRIQPGDRLDFLPFAELCR